MVDSETAVRVGKAMQPEQSARSSDQKGRGFMTTKKASKKATKKSTKKSGGNKKSTRKYSKAAGKSVETEMKEMKEGKLKSGSGKKVTSRKQAIAIGLSKARKAGKKVPPPKKS
jgi:hypothetical protein